MRKDILSGHISNKFKSRSRMPEWLKASISPSKQARMLRQALGMTQQQLAGRIHNSQTLVARIENEQVNPTVSTLKVLADGLNCDLVIQMVPRDEISALLEKRAEEKAVKLVQMTSANFAMELQKPSEEEIQKQIQKVKRDILEKHRDWLWMED